MMEKQFACKRLTARAARELSERTTDRVVDDIFVAIREVAIAGQNCLDTSNYPKDKEVWGSERTSAWEKAADTLRELGFAVAFYGWTHSTKISW